MGRAAVVRVGPLALMTPLLLGNQACDGFYSALGLDKYVDTACGSGVLTPYIGAAFSSVPESLTTGDLIRVIRPGDAVTQDHSESRLNISLNDTGELIELTCG